jgi:hypothetical protein
MGRVDAGAFFIEENGYTVVQHNTADWAQFGEIVHGHSTISEKERQSFRVRSHAFQVKFEGANPSAQIVADKPLFTYNNYFIGNDPSKWATNCRIFQGITVKNIYPNIDVRYYAGDGNVKYDLIVHPGGNPANIVLNYEGADGLDVKGKNLLIKTSAGVLREMDPYSYQYNQTGRVQVSNRYVVKKNKVTFDVKNFDPKTTLVIDPSLVFCSFQAVRPITGASPLRMDPMDRCMAAALCTDKDSQQVPALISRHRAAANGILVSLSSHLMALTGYMPLTSAVVARNNRTALW